VSQPIYFNAADYFIFITEVYFLPVNYVKQSDKNRRRIIM
jgi:hypothetical protein